MKKEILVITIVLFFLSKSTSAQTTEQSIENDKKAQKLTEMYVKSAEVVLPDSVYTILKNFANNRNLPINAVFKQQYLFKMIYNTNLSKEERLIACENLTLHFNKPNAYAPFFLVTDMIKILTSSNK